jgi:cell division protein FtsA
MEGAIELAEEIFHMPVRVGVPQYVTGLSDVVKNPIYSTGVGLLLFGQRQVHESMHSSHLDGGLRGVFERMKNWFQGNF